MRKISGTWICMLLTLVVSVSRACSDPREWMSIPVNNGKQARFIKNFDYGPVRLRRLVFEGESADEWTESLEIIIGRKEVYPSTITGMFSELMAKRKNDCPEMNYEILEEKADSILYEIQAKRCGDYPAEYSITRIIFTPWYVHMAIYNNRDIESIERYQGEWIDRLSGVKIISQP